MRMQLFLRVKLTTLKMTFVLDTIAFVSEDSLQYFGQTIDLSGFSKVDVHFLTFLSPLSPKSLLHVCEAAAGSKSQLLQNERKQPRIARP